MDALIPPEATPVAHGYTLADAERIAGRAARDHPSSLLSHADRRDAGAHAVTVAILAAAERPHHHVLLRAASDAISRAVTAEKHHHGMNRWHETAPRFARYWTQPGPAPFEETVTERIAVRQVLGGLRPGQRRDLEALAGFGSQGAAARSLGTTAVTFRSRVSKARAAAAVLWFAPETAPGRRAA